MKKNYHNNVRGELMYYNYTNEERLKMLNELLDETKKYRGEFGYYEKLDKFVQDYKNLIRTLNEIQNLVMDGTD